jgi:hypothetical protein
LEREKRKRERERERERERLDGRCILPLKDIRLFHAAAAAVATFAI